MTTTTMDWVTIGPYINWRLESELTCKWAKSYFLDFRLLCFEIGLAVLEISPVAWQFCSRGPPDPWGGGGGGAKHGRKPADTKKQRGPGKTQGGGPALRAPRTLRACLRSEEDRNGDVHMHSQNKRLRQNLIIIKFLSHNIIKDM